VISIPDLLERLQALALDFDDRTPYLWMHTRAADHLVMHATIGDDSRLWLTDMGATFAYLKHLQLPLIDLQEARSICATHNARLLATRDGIVVCHEVDDDDSLTKTLDEMEQAMDSLIVAARLNGALAADS